ncbi:hypothetical protein BH09BAC3_BH09BAC3_31670 [soil metagenome]
MFFTPALVLVFSPTLHACVFHQHRKERPSPFTLTLHLTPSTLHLLPPPFHPSPYTLHLPPSTLHLTPSTLHLLPPPFHPPPYTLHLFPPLPARGTEFLVHPPGLPIPLYMQPKETLLNTVEDCIVQAVAAGYSESFRVHATGLTTVDGKHVDQPEEVVVVEKCIFDQNPNSGYHSTVYQIRTIDGKRGVLIDAYGSYRNEKLEQFIRKVPTQPDSKKKKSFVAVINNFFTRIVSPS